jgi:hypothetical protein
MVSPVRVRVPPLLFSRHFQGKRSALSGRPHVEPHLHHNRYHNETLWQRLSQVPREEIVEAHGGLTVHGGGDVGVGATGATTTL